MQLRSLNQITSAIPLASLSTDQIKELQSALNLLAYPAGDTDGLIGPKTRTAWAEFRQDASDGNPTMIDGIAIAALQQQLDMRQAPQTLDFSSQEGTIAAIRWGCEAHGIGLKAQVAYVIATVEWETARTFKPVIEAYWLDDAWRQAHLRYYPYYGRGYVQLTWQNNYEKYGKLLGIDLVQNPDLALKPEYALFILCHGFKTGTFTGRKIADFINRNESNFIDARRCINGSDHSADIAKLAQKYL